MRRYSLFLIASIVVLTTLASCFQEVLDAPSTECVELTFEAVRENNPGTKTEIGGADATEILWSIGDEISIFYGEGTGGGSRFTSTAEEPERTTRFTGTVETITGTQETALDDTRFVGVYPYSPGNYLKAGVVHASFPPTQKAVDASLAKDSFFSMGQSEGLRIAFYNICGGICFTVGRDDLTKITITGNQDESIAGQFTAEFDSDGLPVSTVTGNLKSIVLNAPDGGFFKAGTSYYLTLMPMVFENGFTMTFENEIYRGTRRVEGRVEIVRSEFRWMTLADNDVTFELSATPETIAANLSEPMMLALKAPFVGENYVFSCYGTDEFEVGGDNSNGMWNDYDYRLGATVQKVNSNTVDNSDIWNLIYAGIGAANKVIALRDALGVLPDAETLLGEAYFLRAYGFLFLVGQFGDIPLMLTPDTAPIGEITRNSREEVYARVIEDLETAYTMLPGSSALAINHQITKYAAAHFLAKAHLWRSSEINNDWNAAYISDDLDAVIRYSDEVIDSHPLVSEYNDLFNNFTAYDSSITETNSEIVLSMEPRENQVTIDNRGKWMYSYSLAVFTGTYRSFPLMKRDIASAREYTRLKTTPKYAYFLYDLANDSRFWKSFKTTYAVNNASTNTIYVQGIPYVANEYFPSNNGDYLSSMYIINREDYGQRYYKSEVNTKTTPYSSSYSRQDYYTGKYIPIIMALNVYSDGDVYGNPIGTSLTPDYISLYTTLNKYLDGAVSSNMSNGYRDILIARSSEDYFFKAEALIRRGAIDAGLAILKPLRDRAQYKAGEERDAYVDGGAAYHTNPNVANIVGFQATCSFYPRNSYYYSIGGWDDATVRAATNASASTLREVNSSNYPPEDMAIMDKLGCTTDFDRAMCFLLNEKSREMYGEYLRWMDLARTKTLEARYKTFNDQSSFTLVDHLGKTYDLSGLSYAYNSYRGYFNANIHYYRPIPKTFLDGLTKNGKPLTNAEKAELQNPGY